MRTIPSPEHNHLYSALAPEVKNHLAPLLELVMLDRDAILYEPKHMLTHVFFPIDAIVALIHVIESGASSEVSIIGNDGMVGVCTLLSGENTSSQAWVVSAGYAYRISKELIQKACHKHSDTLMLLLRHMQSLIAQIAQTAVCNRHHSIDQQLCRLLLLCVDRLPCNNLTMTQEIIANMLGVRREGVTEAAGKLQHLEVIHYSRGHILVLDRKMLEKLCCECYRVVKKETDRLLPSNMPICSDAKPLNYLPNIGINSKCPSCYKLDICKYVNKTAKAKKDTYPSRIAFDIKLTPPRSDMENNANSANKVH